MFSRPSTLEDLASLLVAAKHQLMAQDVGFYCRCTTPDYSESRFTKEICAALMQFERDILDGKRPRLAIFAPPRHGKTYHISERFPAWYIGRNPAHKVVATSYNKDLSALCTRRTLDLVQSILHRGAFPQFALSDRAARSDEWETTDGGGYYGVGVGGGLTGRGANVLIIDDPVKSWADALSDAKRRAVWEWYASVAYTRLLPLNGVLLIQTRWHKDDLAGRILERGGFTVLEYPAIDESGTALDPVRYPIDVLNDIKHTIGDTAWRSLYQQQPSDTEGAILKRSWLQFFDTLPPVSSVCISVDAAFKGTDTSDFVSIQAWSEYEKSYYCFDNVTERIGFSDTVAAIDAMMQRYSAMRPVLIVEDKANGAAVIDVLKRKYSRCIPIEPAGGKIVRAQAVQPVFEARRVHIKNASWTDAMINQIADFPTGKNDDQVDAMTQAITWLEKRSSSAARAVKLY